MAEVVIVPSKETGGAIAADAIERLVRARPDAVLGLATGSTPLPVYEALRSRLADVDVSHVRGFALDEYVGLDPAHPESYRSVIEREVVEPLGLTRSLVRTPNGALEDIDRSGPDYEAAIAAAGGIDLQILGIGTNGHIGFNEPGSSLASTTRIKALTEQTRRDNARFFDSIDDVPKHCITQGLGTIQRAKHLVLLAWGEEKADAVAAALEGPVTASVPGSAVQMHPRVTVIIDEAAASKLRNADYYRYAYGNKPDAQAL